MPFNVYVRSWYENPIGEQRDGIDRLAGTFDRVEDARRKAVELFIAREETGSGGARGTWVRIEEVQGAEEP